MRLRSTTAVILLSIVAAACGSSGPAAAPASTDPAPPAATEPATTTTAAPIDEPTDDGAVSAAQIEGRWYPIAVDGVALDTTQGDYWTFNGTDTALEIGGFDGCNGFGTIGAPDPASASIVDGRLENVEMAAEEAGCEEGVESGPYPEAGAQLTVNDDGTVLTSAGPSGTIELSRTAPGESTAARSSSSQTTTVESPSIEASPNMAVDGAVVVGAEFDVSFRGALSESRGGYFWLERPDGTRVALLRSDGNSEIPMGYDLGVDDAMMLDDGLSGDTSRLLLPPDIEPGSYRLCTANSLGDDCTGVDVRAT